ncbi:MAG: YigZ family protein [Candidatus Cloacimonetes bacterium]|nr:YigZ family protein [Candidatus Cloacimonadota bacterium]
MMRYTIKRDVQAQIKVLRSEFIAFLYRVEDTAEAQEILRRHQTEYQNATHNCYAYVLGFEGENQYYSDAGEPGGTAGKPILNSLLRHDLSGVLAVVTRYFGGIKLGVKGLIDAYTLATTEAIKLAERQEYQKHICFNLTSNYAHIETIRHHLAVLGAEEQDAQYGEGVRLSYQIAESSWGAASEFLDGYKALGRLDYQAEE